MNLDALGDWAADHAVNLIIIAVATLIVLRLLGHAIPPAIRRMVMADATPLTEIDLRKRADTLTGVLLTSARITVLAIAALMVAGELGINVVPVIAGLGIGGIAIGLGAQSLVRDAINGILILTENQFGRGDMVKVAGVQGWVEEVNLRRTVLRDLDGTLHSVPNSEIKVASNFTRGYSGVDLLVSVATGTDVDAAIQTIDQVGQDLLHDGELAGAILQAPHVARIESATGAGYDLRVSGRVKPGSQWQAASALRRRIVAAFNAHDIRFGPGGPPAPAAPPTPAPPPAPPPPPPPMPASEQRPDS
ncbi:MAG: mechanosensitive ion channel family protein [Dehalococcoidia bacterium]